jgi:16S rRNA U1498 N3-methylase RsmE
LVDLILAVPRPLRLERILPVVSCIGVGRLVLVGASKVQADYFGSHLFRRPAEMRKGLVEGLSQGASDCLVPEVVVRRNLKKFIESAEFDEMFGGGCQKVVAHPPSASIPLQPVRIASLPKLSASMTDRDGSQPQTQTQSQPQAPIQPQQPAQAQSHPQAQSQPQARIVVAVGPEGGWEDDEVQLLVAKGFQLCSLGPRILRTDMAVPVLLGLAHDWARQE